MQETKATAPTTTDTLLEREPATAERVRHHNRGRITALIKKTSNESPDRELTATLAKGGAATTRTLQERVTADQHSQRDGEARRAGEKIAQTLWHRQMTMSMACQR